MIYTLFFLLLFQLFALLCHIQYRVFFWSCSFSNSFQPFCDHNLWWLLLFLQLPKQYKKQKFHTDLYSGSRKVKLFILDNRIKFSDVFSKLFFFFFNQNFIIPQPDNPTWTTHNHLKKVLMIQTELWILLCNYSLVCHMLFFCDVYSCFLNIVLICFEFFIHPLSLRLLWIYWPLERCLHLLTVFISGYFNICRSI